MALSYTTITLNQIYQEVRNRLSRYDKIESLDFDLVRRYINRAVQSVMYMTLPYKGWEYIEQVPVVINTVLPARFIKQVRMLLSESGNPPFVEARYVDPREYFSVTNNQRGQLWNIANIDNPVYTIWADNQPSRLEVTITPATYEGVLECHMMPPEMTALTDFVAIPFEFYELVVLEALQRCIAKAEYNQYIQIISAEIQQERQKMIELFIEKRQAEKRELDSFIEPVIPLVGPREPEGSLQKNLFGAPGIRTGYGNQQGVQ